MKKVVLGAIMLATLGIKGKSQNTNEPVTCNASLKSVVVYRAGAELTHAFNTTLPAGNVELAVDKVSTDIDLNSVQVHVPSKVTLLGFTYMNDYLAARPKTGRQQLLEDSVDRLTDNLGKLELAMSNNNTLMEVLRKNQELKGTQTGMNVADLQKLMDYYKTETVDLSTQQYDLKKRYAKIEEEIRRIKAQLNEEETRGTQPSGRLLLNLSVIGGGSYDFSLSYITRKAGWVPTYEVRVEDNKDSVKVVCKANINQTTGIDWKQVKMALSTSIPGSWSQAPDLQPWFVAFQQRRSDAKAYQLEGTVAGVAAKRANMDDVVVTALGKSKSESDEDDHIVIRGLGSTRKANTPLYVVDGQIWTEGAFKKLDASAIASVNVLKDEEATALYGIQGAAGAVVIELKKDLADYTGVDQQRLNTIYTIDLPYDLPSSGKDQTVALQTTAIHAKFNYFAVPKLSDDVCLLADIPDWGKLNLVQGKANIVLNGTYQGQTEIDPASTQDTLHLTVGRDKRITLQRKKVTDFSSEKFMSANHFQKFAYEISVRNNKNDSVHVSLLDQVPLSTNKDIDVTLNDAGNAKVNSDKGELRWNLSLKPGESTKVHFSYTLKYPKDQGIAGM